jgi:hypothetical protein
LLFSPTAVVGGSPAWAKLNGYLSIAAVLAWNGVLLGKTPKLIAVVIRLNRAQTLDKAEKVLM